MSQLSPALSIFSQGYQEHEHMLHFTVLCLTKVTASPITVFTFDSTFREEHETHGICPRRGTTSCVLGTTWVRPTTKGLNLFFLLSKAQVIAQLFRLICLLMLTLCLPAHNSWQTSATTYYHKTLHTEHRFGDIGTLSSRVSFFTRHLTPDAFKRIDSWSKTWWDLQYPLLVKISISSKYLSMANQCDRLKLNS